MSEEKEKIDKLTERINDLLTILNIVAEDLRQVSGSLKSLAVSQITQPKGAKAAVATKAHDKKTSIEDVKMMFPENLENLLSFDDKEEFIMIKPLGFLGSDNFAKIASIIREIGGDYISAGRGSHFRVSKKEN